MRKPTSFETAWTEAEASAFAALCTATGTEVNRDAYLGRNPGVLNAWKNELLNLKKQKSVLEKKK